MRLLLDTHIAIAIARDELTFRYKAVHIKLSSPEVVSLVSVASLWEIAIKTRLGKLDPAVPLDRLAAVFRSHRIEILDISPEHAVAEVDPSPLTRDPFDRMLLAQCRVEGLRLVTVDRALAVHPLAWQALQATGLSRALTEAKA